MVNRLIGRGQLTNMLLMGAPWEERKRVWTSFCKAYTIEEVRTQWDYELEGYFLAHCLGTKDAAEFNKFHRVFSIRDKLGFPHCTILCQKDDSWSPYGSSEDLGTCYPFWLGSYALYILQVRGREDKLARWEYFSIVLDWFTSHDGRLRHTTKQLHDRSSFFGDKDLKYHYGYMINQKVNHFDYSFKFEAKVKEMKERGLSL